MNTLKLITKEIAHRKIMFSLGTLAVITAVAMFITFFTAGNASNRETTRLMRDIGFNIRVIPLETDMNDFYLQGFSNETMPEGYIDVFATQKGIGYNHLVAMLYGRLNYKGSNVIIKGLAPEICPPGKAKPPMIFEIDEGQAYVGYELARREGLKKGDQLELAGRILTIAGTLAESGNADDITVQCHLRDAQAVLDKQGEINEIKAIDCLCFMPTEDPLAVLRGQLAEILPEGKVVQMKSMAQARAKQRRLVKNVFAIIMPLVVIVCGAWVGILAMMNVRQRQQEIGLVRALGYGSIRIAALFLGKAVIMGLIGAVVGFAIGTLLALTFGPAIFTVTAKAIHADYTLLYWALLVAPAFAAVSSFIPVMIAVTQDPAVTLREE